MSDKSAEGAGSPESAESARSPERADSPESPPVTVTSKNVTAAELAAVTAVVQAVLEEEGDSLREQATKRGPSAWQRSQRDMRGTITPGPGRWNG